MNTKVIMSITGNQKGIDGEDQKIELITEGLFYEKEGIYFLEYQETEISGMAGTTTVISVEKDRVSMERKGAHYSRFIFEKGRTFMNSYETPFGNLEMGVFSTSVCSHIEKQSGELNLRYQLNIGDEFASSNELFVTFNEDGRNLQLTRKSQEISTAAVDS